MEELSLTLSLLLLLLLSCHFLRRGALIEVCPAVVVVFVKRDPMTGDIVHCVKHWLIQ